MCKEIKDVKDLKVGKKYFDKRERHLISTYSHKRNYNNKEYYSFDYVMLTNGGPTGYSMTSQEVKKHICEYEEESSLMDESKEKVPAVEMRIKGIDDLILQMEKKTPRRILELSLREILLAGGEITIRQLKE
jgi:hypothetical protein